MSVDLPKFVVFHESLGHTLNHEFVKLKPIISENINNDTVIVVIPGVYTPMVERSHPEFIGRMVMNVENFRKFKVYMDEFINMYASGREPKECLKFLVEKLTNEGDVNEAR